eukprot:TRINITY_DN3079_c0_g1_i2.p1 TRINITY_DN3079_c0_g1~~TRINITY_DN3079_c0_g1_i2.p1  ORF type:complete len:649 (+),score=244.36 TRINITY_DN3079_c0_g1_i2:37-1983(+)
MSKDASTASVSGSVSRSGSWSGSRSASGSGSLCGSSDGEQSASKATEEEARPRLMTVLEFEEACRRDRPPIPDGPVLTKQPKQKLRKVHPKRPSKTTEITKLYTAKRARPQPAYRDKPQPKLKSQVSKALADRNILQRRHLPQHVYEQGNVERYYMDLNHALDEKRQLEAGVAELKNAISQAEAKHTQQQKQTEELLNASASISGDKSGDRRKLLLSEQQTLQALKHAMRALGKQLDEKTAELERVRQESKTTHVKELERRVKVYFAEMEQLQKQIEATESCSILSGLKAELQEAQSILGSKEEIIAKTDEKLEALVKKQENLEKDKEGLKEELLREHQESGELQLKLGEERYKLSQDAHNVPLELERLRAEVQAAEAQRIVAEANLERAKHQFNQSMAQLQATEADMAGKVDRCKARKSSFEKRLAELTTLLQQTKGEISEKEHKVDRDREELLQSLKEQYAQKEAEMESAHSANMRRLLQEKEDLEREVREEVERDKLLHSKQQAEIGEVTAKYEERQKILLEKLPTRSQLDHREALRSEERKRIQQLEADKRSLEQELAMLKRHEPSNSFKVEYGSPVFEKLEISSPKHDAQRSYVEEDSPRAETSSQVTRVHGQQGDDEDEGAESLCRGAGGTYLEKGSDSDDE